MDSYLRDKNAERARRNGWNEEAVRASQDLADELALTEKALQAMAHRYWELSNPVAIVTGEGEKIDAKDAKGEIAYLNKTLKAHILESREPICADGLPPLIVQEPSSDRLDVKSLAERSPDAVLRLASLGDLEGNMKAIESHKKEGLIADDLPILPVGQTPRLTWEAAR